MNAYSTLRVIPISFNYYPHFKFQIGYNYHLIRYILKGLDVYTQAIILTYTP
jgi:hypothetical protein